VVRMSGDMSRVRRNGRIECEIERERERIW
jgi:hypothetical protein